MSKTLLPIVEPPRFELGPLHPVLEFQEAAARIGEAARAWIKGMQSEFARTVRNLEKAVHSLFPENWEGVEHPPWPVLESILLDEGIPVMWVPGPQILSAVFSAPDEATRRRILTRRWRGALADCERVLRSTTHPSLVEARGFAVRAVDAFRGGHPESAQALAASLLDTVLRRHLDGGSRSKVASQKAGRFDFDGHRFRVSLTFGPVWCAYGEYWSERGDTIPRSFGRHPTAHAVTRAQYKRINAVIAVMVVTSVLKFLDTELPRAKR